MRNLILLICMVTSLNAFSGEFVDLGEDHYIPKDKSSSKSVGEVTDADEVCGKIQDINRKHSKDENRSEEVKDKNGDLAV